MRNGCTQGQGARCPLYVERLLKATAMQVGLCRR